MSRPDPQFVPSSPSASVLALQLITDEDGKVRPGLLRPVALTADLVCCGDGFNDQTVKVRFGGKYYFVFREHLRGILG